METRLKFRHEYKYICSVDEIETIRHRCAAVLSRDLHAGKDGVYHIRSIYLDDLYDTSVRENEDGVSPREKWRIRSYNLSPERISLECKRKEGSMIQKSSCLLSMQNYESILAGERIPVKKENPPLLNRFLVQSAERILQPKVIVGYHRIPYVCRQGNVRVTLDCNIYSSPDIRSFFEEEIRRRPVLPRGTQLLEVKFDEYLPDYIYRMIQLKNMQYTTFSKYYLCRKFSAGAGI
ncbi:MAG: polyphosphate polymerase domain-containing protein [Blautia sp.]|nr:polyphosphate polymerase domain-containing protein [Blautia sp.]